MPHHRLADAWQMAAEDLAVRVVSPYVLGDRIFAVFLPDFGGPDGLVIVLREAEARGAKVRWATMGRHAPSYDRKTFVLALRDWGYFGAPDQRPRWL